MENDLDLIIMPRYLLPKALIAYDCTEVISIFEKVEEGTIGEPTPAGINNHYRYYFNDEIEDTQEAPRKEEIESILNLYDSLCNKKTFVHCFAGVSRSAAAVYALYCRHLGAGRELDAFQLTLGSAPFKGIWPNERIVAFADEILGRNDAMVNVLADWKAKELLTAAEIWRNI
jgi:predicted protein tyrosine phosphatase